MGNRILTDEQKQTRREYNKYYRETHREIERERAKRFRQNNPERVKEIKRKYRENNSEKIKQYYDDYLAKNGKTRRKILTEEEKVIKYAEQKEKNKIRNKKRYEDNFISVQKLCKYCGTPFLTQYKKSKNFCSDECKHKQSHYMSKLAEKRRNGKITNLDRMDYDITLPLVFNKDEGICKICGKPCDYDDYVVKNDVVIVGKNYPSIDHIIPISKGGSHTWDNVQLAHKYCNSIKSDKNI